MTHEVTRQADFKMKLDVSIQDNNTTKIK